MTLTGVTSWFLVLSFISVGFVYTALPDPFSVTWNPQASISIQTSVHVGIGVKGELAYYFARSPDTTEEDPSESGVVNFTDHTWTLLPKLPEPTGLSCVVPLPNGDTYIIGGALRNSGVWEPNTTVFKFNGETYSKMAPLNDGRFGHGCAYDAATNRIYAMGGRGYSFSLIVSAEYYSISENEWTTLSDITGFNPDFSVINVGDGNIYALGGSFVTDVRRYSIAENTWTTIGQLSILGPKKVLSYFEEENLIMAVGGNDTNWCEYFNLTSNTATPFPCLEATNSSMYRSITVGSFIPERREFYVLVLGQQWKGNFTYVPPTPVSAPENAPEATNEPSEPQSAPQSTSPSAGPISDTEPSGTPTRGPTTRSSITSSAGRTMFGAFGLTVLFAAALV